MSKSDLLSIIALEHCRRKQLWYPFSKQSLTKKEEEEEEEEEGKTINSLLYT